MPKLLSEQADAVYSAIIAKSGMTSRIRSLQTDVAVALDNPAAQDWSEDLATLGFKLDKSNADDMCKSLASAFGTVATEVAGRKLSARVHFIPDTGEVAVAFREVKQRDSK